MYITKFLNGKNAMVWEDKKLEEPKTKPSPEPVKLSQTEWLTLIEKQVNEYLKANGGPAVNPLIQIDALNLKTLISLAWQGLAKAPTGWATPKTEVAGPYLNSVIEKISGS